ncbi:hypothetical protein HKCCE2091_13905 [Rhodobacterales bacterium HKCCE2091]|nr:hypothetical protein [Rhodobacterales bacterium HKCCE2091]
MRALLLVLALWAAAPAAAQDWSFIDPLIARSLDVRAGDSGATLFPDHPDPAQATTAVGFHYFPNRSGGNSFSIAVGVFRRGDGGWTYAGPVEVFGTDPRDPAFAPGRFEITTTMLGPNEPRCCPTLAMRWIVDTGTLTATRLD